MKRSKLILLFLFFLFSLLGLTLSPRLVFAQQPPPRECVCHDIAVSPKKAPTAEGAISGEGDGKIYEVTVKVDWTKIIRCNGASGACSGKIVLSSSSSDWKTDGKKGEVVAGSESHTSGGSTEVACSGTCSEAEDPEANIPEDFTSEYKVKVKKTIGGILTKSVEGTIKLVATPKDCPGEPWTMILKYSSDLKNLTVEIDSKFSDFDGDGLNGIQEKAKKTDPFDPDSDNDGVNDGKDKHPNDPKKQ